MTPAAGATTSQSLSRQACKRCSVNKKKCDRVLPRCTGCVQSDAVCEQPVRTTDRRLLRQVEEERSELHTLRRKVAELEKELNERGLHRDDAAGPSIRATLPPLLGRGNRHPILSPASRRFSPYSFLFRDLPLDATTPLTHPVDDGPYDVSDLPTKTEARDTIRSLLAASQHGPSNLDKIIHTAQLEEDCRQAYRQGSGHNTSPSRFRCFITVYLALCMAAAARGQDTSGNKAAKACLYFGMKEVSSVLAKEDLVTVQALTLLSELAVHDFNGPNLWQMLGLATRTALAMNLHRRDDVFLPQIFQDWPVDREDIVAYNQQRKDLFWALYSLDRLCNFVLNRPTTIPDEEIDVDLPPSIVVAEGKFSAISRDALWIHHLQARRLYGQLQPLHSRNNLDDAQATTSRFAHQIQQWYMWSRFNATVIPFSDESVKRHVLDDVQYHQMIMALYQPSDLVPQVSASALYALKQSASLSLDLFHHSASRHQLNIHWVNLHHAFISCAMLIYCYTQSKIRSDITLDTSEIASKVERCFEVLSLFRGVGPIVDDYHQILQQLIKPLESQPDASQDLPTPVPAPAPAFDFDIESILQGMRNAAGDRLGETPFDQSADASTGMLLPDFWTSVGQNSWAGGTFEGGFPPTL